MKHVQASNWGCNDCQKNDMSVCMESDCIGCNSIINSFDCLWQCKVDVLLLLNDSKGAVKVDAEKCDEKKTKLSKRNYIGIECLILV
jgi:hypothetical protein